MDSQAISAMLKDGSDKREADIDRLVSRLADALTPKITRHIEKYGLPGNTHGLVFDPNRGKKFSTTSICPNCGSDRASHSLEEIKRCFLATMGPSTGSIETHYRSLFVNPHGQQRTPKQMKPLIDRHSQFWNHNLTLLNGILCYHRFKGKPKNLKVPVVEVLQRLTSMYRKSGFVLDITLSEQTMKNQKTQANHQPTFDIKLQPIQASDKPS